MPTARADADAGWHAGGHQHGQSGRETAVRRFVVKLQQVGTARAEHDRSVDRADKVERNAIDKLGALPIGVPS